MAVKFPFWLPVTLLIAQQPVIRVDTRLVEVNVIVRDQNNRPVEGLTKSDFTLYDRGQEQKIAVFSVASTHKTAKPSAPLPPGIYTNSPEQRTDPPGAITVVLLDAVNTAIEDQGYAKAQFIKFLGQIRPGDRIAVYALGNELRILHDFTGDSKALLNTLAHFRGEPLPYTADSEPDPANTGSSTGDLGEMDKWLNDKNALIADTAIRNRVRATVGAMEAIANHIGRLPGRKNLVWVTGSFPFTIGQRATESVTNWNDLPDPTTTGRGGAAASTKAAASSSGSAAAATYGFDNNSLPGNSQPAREVFAAFEDDLARAARALNDADVAVYPVDARGLLALPKIMTAQSNGIIKPSKTGSLPMVSLTPAGMNTMQAMAENTGGRAFYNTNDLEHAIRDAIDDSELTYTLGFYAAASDSQFHKLKVAVDRKRVDVRYRRGYIATPVAAPGKFERDTLIGDALWSPLDSPAVSLGGRVDKAPAGLRLTLVVEPADLVFLEHDRLHSVSLEFAFALFAADGHTLNTIYQNKNMDLDAKQFDELSKRFVVNKTFDSHAELATIRIVLLDCASGRVGSLTLPVK